MKNIGVPILDHDLLMKKLFGTDVSKSGKLERKIVYHLCLHLIEKGFFIEAIYDGEEFTDVSKESFPIIAAMNLIFNLDEASLRITNKEKEEHGILLMIGEGEDIISDWSYSLKDEDGFNAAMMDFDVDSI